MSDDIVNWLRKGGLQGHNEAADEIERLRAELDAERDNNKSLNKHLTRARGNTQKMKAERDELRALLREARDVCEVFLGHAGRYAAQDTLDRIDAALIKGGGDE